MNHNDSKREVTYGALGPENRHCVGRIPAPDLASADAAVVPGRRWPAPLLPASSGGGRGGHDEEEEEEGEDGR